MLRFVKDYALYVHLTYNDDLLRNGSVRKVHARSQEITNKPLRVRTTKTLWLPTWKTNYNAEKCAWDVKKMKNHRKQNFEGEANNMQLDKEDTRRSNYWTRTVNVFLMSWFFYLFLFICSINLLVKYDFILRYEAWVNAIKRLVSLKTFLKSAQTQSLSSEICSRNSREIGRFFHEFVPENPAKFDFFSATYQKPC